MLEFNKVGVEKQKPPKGPLEVKEPTVAQSKLKVSSHSWSACVNSDVEMSQMDQSGISTGCLVSSLTLPETSEASGL